MARNEAPYNHVADEVILADAPEFQSGLTCVPLAFAMITAGDRVAPGEAYRWWHGRLFGLMKARGIKPKTDDRGVPGVVNSVIYAVLMDLNGGRELSDHDCDTGWVAGEYGVRHIPRGARWIDERSKFEGERRERLTVAEVARRFKTGVVFMRRPSHAAAIVDGAIYDSWNSQFQLSARRPRKAFWFIKPNSAAAIDAVRDLIKAERSNFDSSAFFGG